jgi:hypothetical protein
VLNTFVSLENRSPHLIGSVRTGTRPQIKGAPDQDMTDRPNGLLFLYINRRGGPLS